MEEDKNAKIVIIGEASVGKTSILMRYTQEKFANTMMPTLGIDYRIKKINLKGISLKMQIWDTAGQERFKAITQNFYKGAKAIILAFDLNEIRSFQNLKNWIESIEQYGESDCVKIVVANKMDMEQKVVDEQIKEFQNEWKLKVFKVSAKSGENIKQMFEELGSMIIDKYFANDVEEDPAFSHNLEKPAINNQSGNKCC